MGTLDFGLHDILIYEMKNGEKKEENIWRRKIFVSGDEKRRRKYFVYFAYFAYSTYSASSVHSS